MKPMQVTISAFGPYAECVDIPLEQLGEQGIFLITGDTGAGKTTIFDAICYALYGEVSGSNREVKSMRSDFANPQTETYVKLIFSHHGGIYRLERSPEYERPKKRGEGTTKKIADAALYAPDGSVVTGDRDVTQEIKKILGIDAKQFKQIAMIAQGEFLKLLLAKSEERGAIFRSVFRTDAYLIFQQKLKELVKEKRMVFEDSKKRLQELLAQGLGTACTDEMLYTASEQLLQIKRLQTEEEKKRMQAENAVLERTKKIEEKAVERANAAHEQTILNNLEEAQKAYEALERRKAEQEQIRERLLRQREVMDHIRPVYDQWQREVAERERLQRQQAEEGCTESEQQSVLAACEKERQSLPELERALDYAQREATKLQEKWNDYEAVQRLTTKWNTKEEERRAAEQKQNILEEKEKKVTQLLEKIQVAESRLSLREMEAQALAREVQSLGERQADLSELFQKQVDLRQEQFRKERIHEEYCAQEVIWQKAQRRAAEAERLFLREQAGFLAEQLQEGVPCPVCGSLEHPHPAVPAQEAPTQEEWNRLRKIEQEEKQVLEEISASGRACQERLDTMQQEIEKRMQALGLYTKEALQHMRSQLQTQLSAKEAEQREVEQGMIVLRKTAEQKETVTMEKEKQEAERMLQERQIRQLQEELSEIQGQLAVLQERIGDKTYAQAREEMRTWEIRIQDLKDETGRIQANWQQAKMDLERTQAKLEKIREELFIAERQEQEGKERLQTALEMHKMQSWDVCKSYSIPREELERAEQENRRFFEDWRQGQKKLEECRAAAVGIIWKDLHVLDEELNHQKAEKERLEEEQKRLQTSCTLRGHIIRQTETEMDVWQQAEAEYLPILELSKTASGEVSGQEKIAFEQFIQGYYFDHIVEAANVRFFEMTNGRFTLQRAEIASNKRSHAGLELEVFDDFTGKARSVKSLSGGEAFKASLCLALGLSDMIQQTSGGVQMDALFIDEGFGSLDEESREQAMDILQQLTYGSRMVGIISHVSELKERIDKKLIVQKSSKGSTIQVQV